MSNERRGLARSIQARLSRHAREIGADPNLVLTRYAIERFLYRLSQSKHAESFVLKGALLMLAWLGDAFRPTRDADLLGFGDMSDDALADIVVDICSVEVEPDAMTFLPETVRVEPIRFEDSYGGRRVTLVATMGAARLRVQVDVGIGDAVVPSPDWLEYPSLLDMPRPRLKAYTPATVIAEKLHAIVVLGMRNSRMKDYFDLHSLAQENAVPAPLIAAAITATFARRKADIPADWPVGLTGRFTQDASKRTQWKAFLEKNRLSGPPLDQAVDVIRTMLTPVFEIARTSKRQ